MFEINDIVCFRENHKWVGCIGFVHEIKRIKKEDRNIYIKINDRSTSTNAGYSVHIRISRRSRKFNVCV